MSDATTSTNPSHRKRCRASSPKPPLSVPIIGGSQSHNNGNVVNYNMDRLMPLNDVEETLVSQLTSQEPSDRIVALNELLRLTSSHEKNFALTKDAVLRALIQIAMQDCLEWNTEQFEQTNTTSSPVFSSRQTWLKPPTVGSSTWAEHCKRCLGPQGTLFLQASVSHSAAVALQQLEVILVILRNLSFVSANLRLLVYSPNALHLLIGCLYEQRDQYRDTSEDASSSTTSAGTTDSLALIALQTIVHLAPYLDISGQRLLADRIFFQPSCGVAVPGTAPSSSFGQAIGNQWGFGGLWLAKRLDNKEDVIQDVSRHFLLQLTQDYLIAAWSIFSAVHHLIRYHAHTSASSRPLVLSTLDLLQELMNQARVAVVGNVVDDDDDYDDGNDNEDHLTVSLRSEQQKDLPTMRAILVHLPASVLERLIEWLNVPRLGPDSLDYINPVHNIVTRVTTLKLLMGYDNTVDTDVRDRVLDVLIPLLELDSPRMAIRLGTTTTTTKWSDSDKHSTGNRNKRRKSSPTPGKNEKNVDVVPSVTVMQDTTSAEVDTRRTKCAPQVRTRLFDAILPILTTTVGRNEAPVLAAQLLRELAKASTENEAGLAYIQERLVMLASRNPRLSQLVFQHLYYQESLSVRNNDAANDAAGMRDEGDAVAGDVADDFLPT